MAPRRASRRLFRATCRPLSRAAQSARWTRAPALLPPPAALGLLPLPAAGAVEVARAARGR